VSLLFICPQCGHGHKSVAVFCVNCGARMGTPELREVRDPVNWGRVVLDVARSLVLLAVVAALSMMLWPASPAAEPAPDGAAFDARVGRLQKASQQGRYADEAIAEAEINGYLAECTKELAAAPRASVLPFVAGRVYLTFRDGGARIGAVGACGPLPLSFDVDVAAPAAGGSDWRLRGGRVGHLPLPGAAGRWIGRRFQEFFAGWERERDLLVHARRMECAEGKIRVIVGGGPGPVATAPGDQS